MVQFQTCLHAIELLEFDESEATAFFGIHFVSCDSHRDGIDFGEVRCYAFQIGCVGEVTFTRNVSRVIRTR